MIDIINEYLDSDDSDTICIGIELLKETGMDLNNMTRFLQNKGFGVARYQIRENIPAGVYKPNKDRMIRMDEVRNTESSFKYLGPL